MLWALTAIICAGMHVEPPSAQPVWLLFKEPPGASVRAAVESTGARVRVESRWLRALSVSASPAQRAQLARLPGILEMRRVASYQRPRLETRAVDRADETLDLMNAKTLKQAGLTGGGVRVGILDAGFRLTHPVFKQLNVAGALDVVHQDDNVDEEPGQDDPGEAAHGTAILSIVVDLAPDAEYYLAKTEDITRNGRNFEKHIEEDYWVAGLEWCVENGCAVVNSSLGYLLEYRFEDLDGQTSPASRAAVEAMKRGTLIMNAIGNIGADNPLGWIKPPADSIGVFTVGAATVNGEHAGFSATGPTADGRIKPDALALGVDVRTAALEGGFERSRGTSAASALAAGAAALLVEAFPSSSPADMMQAMRMTASNADAPNNRAGHGLINAADAYEYLKRAAGGASVDETTRSALPVLFADLKRRGR